MLDKQMIQVPKMSTKAVAKYMLLPGILPRLKHLGFLFSRLGFIFVQILGVAKLIDANHPCLRTENIGRYRLAEVFMLAWSNVKLDRAHLPQVLMFFAVLAALIITIGLAVSSGVYLVSEYASTAQAQYFGAPPASDIDYRQENDWGLQFLERVFGGKAQTGIDFWIQGDSPSTNQGGNPWFVAILVGMMKTYSKALLMIAIFMIVYLMVITLADAARSGKPFGEKFDSIWAPIRFAVALGMLMPIAGSGYNGAQMLAFQAAEWGSNLGTNLWHRGIKEAESKDSRKFIVATVTDPGYRFVRDMFLINLCVYGYSVILDKGEIEDINGTIGVNPTFTDMDDRYIYSFGNPAAPDFCGSVSVAVPLERDVPEHFKRLQGKSIDNFLPTKMMSGYINAVGRFLPATTIQQEAASEMVKDAICNRDLNFLDLKCKNGPCREQVKEWIYEYWRTALGREVNDPKMDRFLAGYDKELDIYNAWLMESIKQDARFGWASAGAFYMRMSFALSSLSGAINGQPRVTKLPANFYSAYATPSEPNQTNKAASLDCQLNKGHPKCSRYIGSMALNEMLQKGAYFFLAAPKVGTTEKELEAYQKFGGSAYDTALTTSDKEATAPVDSQKLMASLSSTIFDYFKISSSLNPLGQVISWGNLFVNVAGVAYTLAIVSGTVGLFWAGGAGDALASFFKTIGDMFMFPGFILMYMVPLTPFMYFTFAVIEWIVSVVEAVIGLPLWALSFITLEGDLLGKSMKGIKTLFDIILRPPIIVMSLLVATISFTAGVSYFNDAIFLYMGAYDKGVTDMTLGREATGIGILFIYVFGIYSLAIACFKLVDVIPQEYGRWLGLPGGVIGKMDPKYMNVAASAFITKGMGTIVQTTQYGSKRSLKGSAERYHQDRDRKDKQNAAMWAAAMYGTGQGGNQESTNTRQTPPPPPPDPQRRAPFSHRVGNPGDVHYSGYTDVTDPNNPRQVDPSVGNRNQGGTMRPGRNVDIEEIEFEDIVQPRGGLPSGGSSSGGGGAPDISFDATNTTRDGEATRINYTFTEATKLKGVSGKDYKVSDIDKAFRDLGMNPPADKTKMSAQQIKAAYEKLTRKYEANNSTDQLTKIEKAFKILKDVSDNLKK